MGFLDRLKAIVGGGPTLDPGVGDPLARELAGDVGRADMSRTNELLLQLREGRWDDRDFYCDILGERSLRQVLDAWCEHDAGSQVAFLLRGRQAIAWAWEARGKGSSDTVSDEGWNLFHQRLRLAEADLAQAARLDPADPTPYVYMLTTARGLGLGPEAARQRFQAVLDRDPRHFNGNKQMLTTLTEKWGGSHDAMFGFARSAAEASPRSDLWTLIILAHIERWLYFSFDNDEAGAERYLRSDAARREAIDAHARWTSLPGQGKDPPRKSRIYAHNIAAFWFYLTQDRERLQAELAVIGEAASEYPWLYRESDAPTTFAKAKAFRWK
jgi:hypothetical protein